MIRTATLLALFSAVLVPVLCGDIPPWGQCGGYGWFGSGTCQAGLVCTMIPAQNQNVNVAACLPPSYLPPPASNSTTSPGAPSSPATTHPPPTSNSTTSPSTSPPPVTTQPPPTSNSTTSPGAPPPPTTSTSTSVSPISTPATNPYTNRAVYRDPVEAYKISSMATQLGSDNQALSDAYTAVSGVPTFVWLNSTAQVGTLGVHLAQTNGQVLQIVVYNMPNRNCRFNTPAGDFTSANSGQANYQRYIDQIVATLLLYPTVTVVAVIEPNSFANQVAYSQSCSAYSQLYQNCVQYAIKQLNTVPNAHLYIDAGSSAKITTAIQRDALASALDTVYLDAGRPQRVRGLATNVASYNSLQTTTPPDSIYQGGIAVTSEVMYVEALAKLVTYVPAQFIVDQSRSGVANIRSGGGISWCNIKGAGFGPRPSTSTPSPLIDAIVWVKEGGYSDGFTTMGQPGYEPFCQNSDSDSPAPQYYDWFPEYFNTLVLQANPSFL